MLEQAIKSLPGELAADVAGQLRERLFSQQSAAFDEAKVIGAENHARSFRRVDGLGEAKASIPPAAYHYWGQREGYEIWQDKKFMKKYLQDNPEVRVNTHGKAQVGYTGDGFLHAGMGRQVKVYK